MNRMQMPTQFREPIKSRLQTVARGVQGAAGLDASVSYTFLARAIGIAGSTGTVLFIVRFLSPVEQGYYYTLLSLVSLQSVFEMGFSFVIQQLAAHECVQLELTQDGIVRGDRAAHARLASTLQLSVRWYSVAALAMGVILVIGGGMFFARHAVPGGTRVAWKMPWFLAVATSMVGLWCIPFYSFLEGCGHVRAVAAMRLRQAVASVALAWTAMLLGRGLLSPALVIAGQASIGLGFLATRNRLLAGLLRHPAREGGIHWSRDVWPFQWRIAVSWMCSYFTLQVFIPIIFALRGSVQAGQIGMSVSITGYMTVLALAWTSTKATPFGRLIARKEFHTLDRLFLRTLFQSAAVLGMIAAAAVTGVALLPAFAPHLAARMVSPGLFALLVVAAFANHIVQSLAILLRSFKREPFLLQSVLVAALTLTLAILMAPKLGNAGVVLSYLAATGFVGLPSALMIFTRTRRSYLAEGGRLDIDRDADLPSVELVFAQGKAR